MNKEEKSIKRIKIIVGILFVILIVVGIVTTYLVLK